MSPSSSSSSSSSTLTFRPPISADYLRSPLRHAVLGSFEDHEIVEDDDDQDDEDVDYGMRYDHDPSQHQNHHRQRRAGDKMQRAKHLDRREAQADQEDEKLQGALVTWHAMRSIMDVKWWAVY